MGLVGRNLGIVSFNLGLVCHVGLDLGLAGLYLELDFGLHCQEYRLTFDFQNNNIFSPLYLCTTNQSEYLNASDCSIYDLKHCN